MVDQQLREDLLKGVYHNAYDVIARRYVRLLRVQEDSARSLVILARRESDGSLHNYRVHELSKFT